MFQPTQNPPIERRWTDVSEAIIAAETSTQRDIIWQREGVEDVEALAWT